MLFNSTIFPLFFVVVWLLWRYLPARARNPLLLAASYLFYGWWDWRFLGLIALTTGVDWLCGLFLDSPERRHRKLVLGLSIGLNTGILGLFKYLGFFVSQVASLLDLLGLPAPLPILHIIVPVGLSFYTLQSMSYAFDVYRGRIRATRSLPLFALYVSFFPQLVAGPIERSERLIPQLQHPRVPTPRDFAEGAHLMLWGFFKKLFVADNLAVLVSRVFDEGTPQGGFMVLLAAYAFTWQIYCDFSGYSDIARGVARFFGVELMLNFNLPFFATSPRDHWRRWHISLSTWLKDYLYFSLGGNRLGKPRMLVNLGVTMVLGGLWHGAAWTYVVWGAYHGLALVVQRLLPPVKGGRTLRFLRIILTFHFICVGLVLFRSHSLTQFGQLVLSFLSHPLPQPSDHLALVQLLALCAVPLAWETAQYLNNNDHDLFFRLPRPVQGLTSALLLVAILILGATHGQQFIYFQF